MQTIFATATAPLKSGVAIIRVSGPEALACVKSLIGDIDLPARKATLHKLINPNNDEIIDEAIILWFPKPHSFTGEDIIELHTHGSIAVISELSSILSTQTNTRLAEPGEFSKRAFDNNKMDLTEAEGLADLIDAETLMQARQATRQKQGVLKDLYDSWRKEIISILANIEAYIDFPDEDIPDHVMATVVEQVKQLKSSINRHLDDDQRGEKLRNGVQAVIIGAPNTGKSSLLNLLAQRDAAIVSDIAGTTRDAIEVHLDLHGYPLTLIDTAGLRETPEQIEAEGIRRTLDRTRQADIKILLFDASDDQLANDSIFNIIDGDTIIVINKCDLVDKYSPPTRLAKFSPICISIKDDLNIDLLISSLEDQTKQKLAISSDPVITRQRHRNQLNLTLQQLDEFNLDKELELSSENLRQSAVELGKITGHINIEEILDDIFHNFCIGK